MVDYIALGIFPYVSVALGVILTIYRYYSNRYSFSSFSSQFFEGKALFFGSIPWHYGIIPILSMHLLGLLFPGFMKTILGSIGRLYFLEITGIAIALYTLIAIVVLLLRRLLNPMVQKTSTFWDIWILFLLIVQVLTGLYIATSKRWGGLWYLDTAVPWLWSLIKLNPQLGFIQNLPFLVKLHFFNAFLIVLSYPFSRLVHVFTFPVRYLFRPYQLVVWNKGRRM